jgi:mono/diheme cytochrome c family protein
MRNCLIVVLAFTELLGCSDQDKPAASTQQSTKAEVSVVRNLDSAQIRRGQQLFLHNCATCHGQNAQGAPNWSRPDANGKYPPPPLNGSGHAWHHPQRALLATIKFGTARIGGSMPAWQDKLSDQDIDDIIAWFQSLWPDELYAAWQRTNQASQQGK